MSYQAVRIRSSSFSQQQQGQWQQEQQTKQTGSRSASRDYDIETRPSAPSIQRRKSSDNPAAATTRTQRSRRNSSVVEAKSYSVAAAVSPSDNNNNRVEGDEEDPVNSILNGLDVIKALVESFENTLAKDWKLVWMDPGISIKHFESVNRELERLKQTTKRAGSSHYYGDARLVQAVAAETRALTWAEEEEERPYWSCVVSGGGYFALARMGADCGVLAALPSDSVILAVHQKRKTGGGCGGPFAPFSASFQPSLLALERYIVTLPALAPRFLTRLSERDLVSPAPAPQKQQQKTMTMMKSSMQELDDGAGLISKSAASSTNSLLFMSRSFSGSLAGMTTLASSAASRPDLMSTNTSSNRRTANKGGNKKGKKDGKRVKKSSSVSTATSVIDVRRSETPVSVIMQTFK